MIKKIRYEKDRLKRIELKKENIVSFLDIGINETGCIAVFEEFRSDVPWKKSFTLWADEFHYVIEGKAEITYTSPPLHEKEEKIIVEAGDAYFTPIGICEKYRIIGSETFLHLNVVMPRPKSSDLGYPLDPSDPNR